MAISDIFKSTNVSQIANQTRADNRRNRLEKILQPHRERQIELEAQQRDNDFAASLLKRERDTKQSDLDDTIQGLAAVNVGLGSDFDQLDPATQQQRFANAVQMAGQIGYDIDDAPEQLTPELLGHIRAAGQKAGAPTAKFGRVIEATDSSGNSVFFTTDSAGQSKVIEGFTPPVSVQQQKLEQDAKKEVSQNNAQIKSLSNRANRFADLLQSPAAKSATGVRGLVEGTVGRFTGSDAGKIKAGLDRLGTGMILEVAEQLKGTMSDGDVKLLKSTMPKGSDDPVIWQDWYEEEFVAMVKQRAEEKGIAVDVPEKINFGGAQEANGSSMTDEQLKKALGL